MASGRILAPREEPVAGPSVSAGRVRVADVGGEEFDIVADGLSPRPAINAGTAFGARQSG
jgi:hypothetical protein